MTQQKYAIGQKVLVTLSEEQMYGTITAISKERTCGDLTDTNLYDVYTVYIQFNVEGEPFMEPFEWKCREYMLQDGYTYAQNYINERKTVIANLEKMLEI